jgi:hypothetical protein
MSGRQPTWSVWPAPRNDKCHRRQPPGRTGGRLPEKHGIERERFLPERAARSPRITDERVTRALFLGDVTRGPASIPPLRTRSRGMAGRDFIRCESAVIFALGSRDT